MTAPTPARPLPYRVARIHARLLAAATDHPGPCRGRSAWIDEDPATRARAAQLCRDACPGETFRLCAEFADAADVRHGVYAGTDRTTTSTTTSTTERTRT